MNNVYLQDGRAFTPADPKSLNVTEKLPPGTYTVVVTPKGLHLELIDNFELKGKLYGDVDFKANRIMATFLDRPSSTGVLLFGQKGSGKTMLTKRISQLAQSLHGIVTIVINQPLCGEKFNSFIQSIEQPAVVLFDEFEKVYNKEAQQALLTIFDGTYSSQKLFLLTCNDRWRVDSYMHNRPGRLYYSLEFGGLSSEFITEYCQDNLNSKDNLAGVVACSGFFGEFSFDMLKALVEEMNRYNETATQAMQILNIKPESDTEGNYICTVMRDGKPVVSIADDGTEMGRSPLMNSGWSIWLKAPDEDYDLPIPDGCITESESFSLDIAKLKSVDAKEGTFTFGTHRADTTLVFKRVVAARAFYNYDVL